jgi:threonine/homoserine/homoserine lactone efflux protein
MRLMPDQRLFVLFLVAAALLAVTPGPGIFYVLGRTISGGRSDGLFSSLGTFFGGLVHVFAAALGLSAILAASATAFSIVKFGGALYIVWIGFGMIAARHQAFDERLVRDKPLRVFRQGILTEMLNPKTALFFLSFLPQFVNPHLGHVVVQFLVLGSVSVTLNTMADVGVVLFAAPLGSLLRSNPRFRRNQRIVSGVGMIGLGAYMALAERN